MLPQFFVLLIIPLGIWAIVDYCSDITSHKIKPNLSTWGIWFLSTFVAFLASIANKVAVWEVLDLLVFCSFPVAVITCSVIHKQFYIESKWLEIICFVLAILGLVFLGFNPQITIGIQILVDLLAAIPTLLKIWYSPKENESLKMFAVVVVITTVKLLTISQYNFDNSAFTVYLLLLNLTFCISIIHKSRTLTSKNS
jgi:hypothetical protein